VEARMMRDTLAGQMWPCERICGWLWRLWVLQLYRSTVSEVVAKGKISTSVKKNLSYFHLFLSYPQNKRNKM